MTGHDADRDAFRYLVGAVKLKSKCCEKWEAKARACKACPVMAAFTKKRRRKKLAKIRKRLKAA